MKKTDKKMLYRVSIIGLLMYLTFEIIIFGVTTYTNQNKTNELKSKSNTIQTEIENIFQSTTTISEGYLSFITSNLDASKEETESFLEHILFYDVNYVKNIAVLENTTIKYNYPLEDNESSIGIDLSAVEAQREDVLFVKDNLEPLFIGPVSLIQGGTGFVIRIPVLEGIEYWGQIAIVLDADDFIQVIESKSKESNVDVRITNLIGDSEIIVIGDEIKGNSVSSVYNNKYVSWKLEISESSIRSTFIEDIIVRILGILIISMTCYYIYRSMLLNKEIMYNSEHDYLTGDYNRAKFSKDFNENKFNGKLIAFADVNKFKVINDTLGHLFGDWCLMQLSDKFNEIGDFVTYRISGDEFILVSTNLMSVDTFKEKVLSANYIFYSDKLKQDIDLSISVGVLEKLNGKINLESMLMYLDYAMYDAKKENKKFTIVNERLMHKYDEVKSIEQQLIADVKKGKIIPYYQPIINIKNGTIDGFEVLARWYYKGEIRSAGMFIGVIKKVKYVDLVDQNLFNKLQVEYLELLEDCEQIKDFTFSVNLSAESLMIFEKDNKKFDHFVKKQIIPNKNTIFEVSEDINLGVISIDTLRYIQSKGYNVAVDDFGAGVSKLSDVLSGELKSIKTDKSLLPSKYTNDKKIDGFFTVIKAIKASGSTICVEGVETMTQLEMAIDAGGKLVQGFLFSKPIPKDEVVDFINNFDYSRYKK